MNLVDHMAQITALLAGAMVISHAYLSGFKDRGFPGQPWAVRGCMLMLGLALWVRAGMIWPASQVVSYRYPHGHHVTNAECTVYVAFAVLLTVSFVHYFSSAHRWYAEGIDLGVDSRDVPDVKNVPDQIRDTLREEVPRALVSANTALLDGLSGPVKAHGGKK